jgi:hypothetical protein
MQSNDLPQLTPSPIVGGADALKPTDTPIVGGADSAPILKPTEIPLPPSRRPAYVIERPSTSTWMWVLYLIVVIVLMYFIFSSILAMWTYVSNNDGDLL